MSHNIVAIQSKDLSKKSVKTNHKLCHLKCSYLWPLKPKTVTNFLSYTKKYRHSKNIHRFDMDWILQLQFQNQINASKKSKSA